ncbi:hypothetical protein M3Y96_00120300 [Aphelenchoides besseyi]|nr:hypothetical protein M3Y96_00120300 [Aphelenchoides besseyi]
MANGTFAKSKRGLICETLFDDCYFAHPHSICGTNGRYQVVYKPNEERTYGLVDTFNNVQKELTIDISAVGDLEGDDPLSWGPFHFDNTVGFFGRVEQLAENNRAFLFCGDLDFVNCILKINTVTEIPGSYECARLFDTKTEYWVVTENTNEAFPLSILNYKWVNGRFLHQNTINLGQKISFPSLQNGKLFGWLMIDSPVFPSSMDQAKFIEVSLADGSTKQHNIEEKNRLTERVDEFSRTVWIEDKFLIGLYNLDDDVSTIVQFDASKKEWKTTEMETEGEITEMSTTDGLLIVNSKKPGNKLIRTYRFNYNQTDSLTHLTWGAMRQHSGFNPEFYNSFISKIPKNSHFHPLW